MNSIEIQKNIDKTNYIDARVTKLKCDYFADEVRISFEDEKEISILCSECYKVHFNHIEQYKKDKPLKLYTIQQIPYFIQNIEVKESEGLYDMKINMYPLYIDIRCKSIRVL